MGPEFFHRAEREITPDHWRGWPWEGVAVWILQSRVVHTFAENLNCLLEKQLSALLESSFHRLSTSSQKVWLRAQRRAKDCVSRNRVTRKWVLDCSDWPGRLTERETSDLCEGEVG